MDTVSEEDVGLSSLFGLSPAERQSLYEEQAVFYSVLACLKDIVTLKDRTGRDRWIIVLGHFQMPIAGALRALTSMGSRGTQFSQVVNWQLSLRSGQVFCIVMMKLWTACRTCRASCLVTSVAIKLRS